MGQYSGTLNQTCNYSIGKDGNGTFLRQNLISDGSTSTCRTELGADGTSSFVANFNDQGQESARPTVATKFKIRVPSLKLDQSDQALIFQLHQIRLSAPTFSPVASIILTDTGYVCQLRRSFETPFAGGQRYHNIPIGGFAPGEIDEFILVCDVKTNPAVGSIQIYRNGYKKVDVSQPTRLDITDAQGTSGLYLKTGIYMPGWSSTGGAVGRYVNLDLFDLKVGDSYSDVA